MHHRLRSLTTIIVVLMAACGDDAASDAGLRDGGAQHGDTASQSDSMSLDAGATDASQLDSAPVIDAGAPDARDGSADAGQSSVEFRRVCFDFEGIDRSMLGPQEGSFVLPASAPEAGIARSMAELRSLYEGAAPGSVIRIADGTYNDVGRVNLGNRGSDEIGGTGHDDAERIYIVPESEGGVRFDGDVEFNFFGPYTTVAHFVFDGGAKFRFWNRGVRLTNNDIRAPEHNVFSLDSTETTAASWCEIDSNNITQHGGVVYISNARPIAAGDPRQTTRGLWFHHNHVHDQRGRGTHISGRGHHPFSDIPAYASGDQFHVFEWNIHEDMNIQDEDEWVSIKGPAWVFRHNWLAMNASSGISMRMSDRTLIFDNVIVSGTRNAANYCGEGCERSWNVFNVGNSRGWRIPVESVAPEGSATSQPYFSDRYYLTPTDSRSMGNVFTRPSQWVDILGVRGAGATLGSMPSGNTLSDIYFGPASYNSDDGTLPLDEWETLNPQALESMQHFLTPDGNCADGEEPVVLDMAPRVHAWEDIGPWDHSSGTIEVAPGPLYRSAIRFLP